jgi:hypothetical protein
MMVSNETLLSGQAGFLFSDSVRCLWCSWPTHFPDLELKDYFLRATSKERYTNDVLPILMT